MIGATSILTTDPGLVLQPVIHPVHQVAVVPEMDSDAVDFWPDLECRTPNGDALNEDMLGARRMPSGGAPPDGNGDGVIGCDAGAIELPETPRFPISGSGSGTVTSTPAGIECPSGCSANFVTGAQVSLTATPQAGSQFFHWGGACSGFGDCDVTMDSSRQVFAVFGASDAIFIDGFE